MIQGADSPDRPLEEIASRIVGAVRPWRVVLFGSRARGNPTAQSDYDIFVEIDADRTTAKQVDLQIRELFADDRWLLDFKVRPRGEIERRRDDPGTLEWTVAREGRVLYADPAAPTDLLPPGRVREPEMEPPESRREWMASAERDLRHCADLWATGKDYFPEICWLSHQTAEKYMKALLIARHVCPERTHDLVALLRALRSTGCPLPGLDADCALLTTHAIAPRYPVGLSLDEEDARAAFAAAARVTAAMRADLPAD